MQAEGEPPLKKKPGRKPKGYKAPGPSIEDLYGAIYRPGRKRPLPPAGTASPAVASQPLSGDAAEDPDLDEDAKLLDELEGIYQGADEMAAMLGLPVVPKRPKPPAPAPANCSAPSGTTAPEGAPPAPKPRGRLRKNKDAPAEAAAAESGCAPAGAAASGHGSRAAAVRKGRPKASKKGPSGLGGLDAILQGDDVAQALAFGLGDDEGGERTGVGVCVVFWSSVRGGEGGGVYSNTC